MVRLGQLSVFRWTTWNIASPTSNKCWFQNKQFGSLFWNKRNSLIKYYCSQGKLGRKIEILIKWRSYFYLYQIRHTCSHLRYFNTLQTNLLIRFKNVLNSKKKYSYVKFLYICFPSLNHYYLKLWGIQRFNSACNKLVLINPKQH